MSFALGDKKALLIPTLVPVPTIPAEPLQQVPAVPATQVSGAPVTQVSGIPTTPLPAVPTTPAVTTTPTLPVITPLEQKLQKKLGELSSLLPDASPTAPVSPSRTK